MRRSRNIYRFLAIASALVVSWTAVSAELDGFLAEIDVTARKDPGLFRSDLSVTFGVSSRELDGLFRVSSRPSDVYMFLRIAEVARIPVTRVVEVYKDHGDEGWGVMAKSLGIKPGSDEFHALKAGRLPGQRSGSVKGKRPR